MSLFFCAEKSIFLKICHNNYKKKKKKMKTVLVSLPSVEKVKEFNTKIFPLEGDFDLGTGRYIVDARSIMGIFSLDLSKPVSLTINSDNEEEVVEAIREFIVTE